MGGGDKDFAPTMYRLGALVNNSKCSKMSTGNAGYLNKVEFTYSKILNKFNNFNFVTDFIISKFIKLFHLIFKAIYHTMWLDKIKSGDRMCNMLPLSS